LKQQQQFRIKYRQAILNSNKTKNGHEKSMAINKNHQPIVDKKEFSSSPKLDSSHQVNKIANTNTNVDTNTQANVNVPDKKNEASISNMNVTRKTIKPGELLTDDFFINEIVPKKIECKFDDIMPLYVSTRKNNKLQSKQMKIENKNNNENETIKENTSNICVPVSISATAHVPIQIQIPNPIPISTFSVTLTAPIVVRANNDKENNNNKNDNMNMNAALTQKRIELIVNIVSDFKAHGTQQPRREDIHHECKKKISS